MEIFGIILFGIGFFFNFYGLNWVIVSHRSRNWPSIFGEVVSLGTKQNEASNGRKIKYTTCEISYKFKVNATQYIGDKIYLKGHSMNSDDNKLICKQFSEGSSIEIFYNPKNPNKCVLIRQTTFPFFIIYFIGIILMILGVFIFFDKVNSTTSYVLNLIEIIP